LSASQKNPFRGTVFDNVAQNTPSTFVRKTALGYKNLDIITLVIDRLHGVFQFFVNRKPSIQGGGWMKFAPLQLSFKDNTSIMVGCWGGGVLRYDFGEYGYSCVTNAVR
jgi:hypothetical protein